MKTPIKSTDPRKKMIVEALKKVSGANKVTSVYRISESEFQGDCLKGNRSGYENMGAFTVTMKTCEYCGKSKQDVSSTDDPYMSEIQEDYSQHFLCDDCYQRALEDI